MKSYLVYWKYLTYLTAIAIAFSLPASIKAEGKTDPSLGNLRERLVSDWENTVLTRTLESTTEINEIEFSPNGQLLASVGASQISIWNLSNGSIQRILPGHYASEIELEIAPTAIAFSPDSRYLATSTWSQGLLSSDRAILVRDVATGEEVLSISDRGGCRKTLFDASGDVIYGACDSGVTAWSFPDGEELFSFDTEYPVEAIALSPDGKVMATVDANVSGGQQGEQSNSIQLWQLDSVKPTLLKTLNGHANEIVQLKFTADGKRLVSSSYDGKINVWNWQQGTTDRKTNNLHSDRGIFSLSANSQLIAGNFNSSIMTDLATGLPLRNVMKLPHKQDLLAFNPQQQLLARVQNKVDGNIINLWTTNTATPEKSANRRDNYRVIPIGKYWIDRQQPPISLAPETQAIKPSSIGTEPQAIALSGLGFAAIDPESASVAQQDRLEVKQNYLSDNLATVTIAATKLSDDSVEGQRYLIEFAPYGDRSTGKWQIVWAGEQFRCWAGRGHQDWGTDLCH